MVMTKRPFTAVVLAGDRKQGDPVAQAAGVACKALTPVCGIPMLIRVLNALAESVHVNRYILCGPDWSSIEHQDEIRHRLSSGAITWVPQKATPSTSAFHVLQFIPHHQPVLVTTADHALLNSHVVDYFCRESMKTGADITVGLALHKRVTSAFPGIRRTAIRLKDASYCSCNLFAFLTHRSRKMAEIWRQVENQRKKPWLLMRFIGWKEVLRYLLNQLTLNRARRTLSYRLNIRAEAVLLPFPEAAVDVDTVSDWKFAETIANHRPQIPSDLDID
jgi:GTP:adenosylcobinamide-phosphate guanylyltransferase